MTTKWAHLPNAKHIDRVLADLRARPKVWTAAWTAARGDALGGVWAAARDAALYAIHGAALDAAWDAVRDAAWGTAGGTAGGATGYAALDTAWGATRALVAWDDCSELLDLPPDAVRLLAMSGHHPAVMLYPAVLAFNT